MILPLRKEKIEECIEIIEKSFNKPSAEAAAYHLKSSFGKIRDFFHEEKYFICQLNSKVVGIVGIYSWNYHPRNTCWLGWFCVRPKYRGKGIGKKLLEFILEYAKKNKYKKFYIETTSHRKQKAAINLFKKFGFEEVGRIKNYYKGFDLIYLAKELS